MATDDSLISNLQKRQLGLSFRIPPTVGLRKIEMVSGILLKIREFAGWEGRFTPAYVRNTQTQILMIATELKKTYCGLSVWHQRG